MNIENNLGLDLPNLFQSMVDDYVTKLKQIVLNTFVDIIRSSSDKVLRTGITETESVLGDSVVKVYVWFEPESGGAYVKTGTVRFTRIGEGFISEVK